MRKLALPGAAIFLLVFLFFSWDTLGRVGASILDLIHDDPDYPRWMQSSVSKEEFMQVRSEAIALRRGIKEDQLFDPAKRIQGIKQLRTQELARLSMSESNLKSSLLTSWTPIGPSPIPNGQVNNGPSTSASGRVVAIAVHPTNPDIAYVGTAQGGLYRTTDGGGSWVPLLDDALSLAVNAIEFVPGQPETIFVGTGEAGFCSDCFFGVGIYRIDNASTSADVSGPIATSQFAGRSISKIVIHPTNPNIMFVASASGQAGIGSVVSNVLAPRGIFRSTNALDQFPTFTKLTVSGLTGQDRAFVDIVVDPADPNLVLASEVDTFSVGEGGVYRSVDGASPNPTFIRTLPVTGLGSNNSRTELALHRAANGTVTVYAASAKDGGTLHRSTDGGLTWIQTIDNDFCNPQCFYDIAVAVDPNNANNVFLGGSPTLVFGRSNTGGFSFSVNGSNYTSGLHVDTHAIAVAPSDPSIVYLGTDGGIYRTNNVQASPIVWTSLNNSRFSATQFMSVAIHPSDPNFSIGGTQDNGTSFFRPDGTWQRIDGGDGGYAVIDQNAVDTVNVREYHTYFNRVATMAFARSLNSGATWTLLGCGFAGATANGITCPSTATLFYAPLVAGPGDPNTLYFGTDVLYRSSNGGSTMTKVSQEPIESGVPISAIGIAPQNDNIRIVGMRNGGLFGTTNGSPILVTLDPLNQIPSDTYIARAAVDPANADRAYITLSAFGVPSVWKTENLSGPIITWQPAATGLPQVPVSAFAIDRQNSNILYAGTDIGVYVSTNGGVEWLPLGEGLPRVAVFDMAVTNSTPRKLRIATHGRGMWEYELPAASPIATVSGRVLTSGMAGLRNASVTIVDQSNFRRTVPTSSLGYFSLENVPTGASYTLYVASRRYRFGSRGLTVNSDLADVDFIGLE